MIPMMQDRIVLAKDPEAFSVSFSCTCQRLRSQCEQSRSMASNAFKEWPQTLRDQGRRVWRNVAGVSSCNLQLRNLEIEQQGLK